MSSLDLCEPRMISLPFCKFGSIWEQYSSHRDPLPSSEVSLKTTCHWKGLLHRVGQLVGQLVDFRDWPRYFMHLQAVHASASSAECWPSAESARRPKRPKPFKVGSRIVRNCSQRAAASGEVLRSSLAWLWHPLNGSKGSRYSSFGCGLTGHSSQDSKTAIRGGPSKIQDLLNFPVFNHRIIMDNIW